MGREGSHQVRREGGQSGNRGQFGREGSHLVGRGGQLGREGS